MRVQKEWVYWGKGEPGQGCLVGYPIGVQPEDAGLQWYECPDRARRVEPPVKMEIGEGLVRYQAVIPVYNRDGSKRGERVSNSYFPEVRPGYENRDVCLYCGTPNTDEKGESMRYGWDCWFCGGN